RFFGSMGGQHVNRPIAGMASTPTGKGYWFVAADGGIYSFGDAQFLGSGTNRLHAGNATDIAARLDGQGYWIATDT
ncbi:MAG: Esterase, partial [Actinomycetia bacterium]|nr:Esterase [Actinomycetes bacterium]